MLKQKRYTAVVLLVLALIATVFYLFPLVLVLTNSLKTTGEFTSNPFSLPTVLQLQLCLRADALPYLAAQLAGDYRVRMRAHRAAGRHGRLRGQPCAA